MGLHKDPTTYITSPVECQVRRLIWHQICFLDLRTCEATGPRPQIRPDDFDTQFPRNIDDADLDRVEHGDRSIDVGEDRTHFTDMTITRMRFECYDMHRYLWVERPKLERTRKEGERKITISSLLARIQSFKAAMEKTYLPMLSKTAPLHALASEIYGILSNRLYIHILQKYLSSDRHRMPDRLRQVVLSAAIMILEHSQNIEQQPALSTWSWYVGALHQYHTALLILNEMYAQPPAPAMEQRAWRALDFAFDLGPGMTNIEKTRTVLEELTNKMQVYASIKRWRAPKDMPQAGPRTHTPGYQLRQQEAEERARHDSLQAIAEESVQTSFGNANSAVLVSPLQQQPFQQPKPPQLQSRNSDFGVIGFPGAMPNADWGTFNGSLLPSISAFPEPPTSPDMYPTLGYPPAPSNNLIPPHMVSQDSNPTSFTNPSAAVNHGAPTSTTDSSPLDALNEIDWVSASATTAFAMTGCCVN